MIDKNELDINRKKQKWDNCEQDSLQHRFFCKHFKKENKKIHENITSKFVHKWNKSLEKNNRNLKLKRSQKHLYATTLPT